MLYEYSDFAEAAVVDAAHPTSERTSVPPSPSNPPPWPPLEELRDFVKERVAGQKHPRNTHIVDALPKVPSGNPQV